MIFRMGSYGRDVLFRSGDIFLPQAPRRWLNRYIVGDETTLFYLNRWSVLHFLSGIFVGYILRGIGVRGGVGSNTYYIMLLIIHTVWELWQIIINMTQLTLRGFIDIITDTLVFMLGGILVTGAGATATAKA